MKAYLPLLVCVFFAASCEKAGARGKDKPDAGVKMEEIRIEETTVARIGGVKIAVGNIWNREYVDQAGTKRKGPVATFSLVKPGAEEAVNLEVWEGYILDLGNDGKWKVASVVEGKKGENGYVVLTR